MGSDWDFINDHMGGHDENGLPNFMSKANSSDDSYHEKEVYDSEKRRDDRHLTSTDNKKVTGVKNHPIKRDLCSHKSPTSKSVKSISDYPNRHGAKWTTDEINSVKTLFISGLSILKISEIKERTAFSIAWQLSDMKLITPEQKKAVKDGNSLIYYFDINQSNHKTYFSNKNAHQLTGEIKKDLAIENQTKDYLDKNGKYKKENNKTKENFFEVIIRNLKIYFFVWVALILVNQITIFNACFAPYCLSAALPHTGIIAAIITYLIKAKHPKA